jgi:hypothetical protein
MAVAPSMPSSSPMAAKMKSLSTYRHLLGTAEADAGAGHPAPGQREPGLGELAPDVVPRVRPLGDPALHVGELGPGPYAAMPKSTAPPTG